jgi:AAA15 family ATPase/GTPase
MILEFSVKNFLSFKEKVTFSMIANSNKELNDNYVEIGGNKVLKSAAVYGANASGKSNLFKILTLVVLMLRSSNSVDINAKLPLIPFKLDKGSVNKPSEFEIKFILDETRYVYGFIADKDKIYDEYLYYYPNGRETKIFDRTNINEYSYTQKDEKILREIEAKNAQNKFFLATATNWNFDKTKAAYNFLTNGIGTCNNLEILKNMAYKMYETNPDYLKDFAIDFLQKADFNIEDYQISQIDVPGEFLTAIPEFITKTLPDKPKAYQVLFKHKNSDNYLSIDEESLGTQMIFAFIPFLADSLKNKKVLIIDELDKSLHPFLVQYIVEIFNDAEINKNGSQLIFNTHDTNLLDLNILRRDQIWFTEKNSETGESDLYSLSDFSVRKQENVEKGYMLGRYGAVPFIKNDFNLWEEE